MTTTNSATLRRASLNAYEEHIQVVDSSSCRNILLSCWNNTEVCFIKWTTTQWQVDLAAAANRCVCVCVCVWGQLAYTGQDIRYLITARRYVSVVYAVAPCLSVRLSVLHKPVLYQNCWTTPHNSRGILVSYVNDLGEIRTGSPQTGRHM